ncbi:MAG TPA: efflux RND transporter periplasmic adaptor subunit, partial [Gammaproteobacteria bacterium]|nr:efflux RND transporter periplasmic adaptor subunit [Gammaproteobacteria bacterium]
GRRRTRGTVMTMTRRLKVGAVVALVIAVLAGYGISRFEALRSVQTPVAGAGALKPGDVDPATGKRVLYWHDPMVPNQRFDAPGRSPFMNMALVPVYEGGDSGADVAVSSRMQQNLAIRTAEVAQGTLAPRIEAVGIVAFNERDQAVMQARATGFVEKLHARATFDRVKAGQPLAELYVPEWVAAQEELLALLRMRASGLDELIAGARQRMRQAGMTDEQIRRVEQSGEAERLSVLRSPLDGVVTELGVREGMTVMPGDTLFRLNGLSTVWVNVAVPESQAALLRPGAAVEARSPAVPGTVYRGSVIAVLPHVDAQTRTISARVELANADGRLSPGTFASVTLSAPDVEALLVPTEAVIQTGRRAVVMVAEPNGGFTATDVETGVEANGQTEIKRGLAAGQRVVVSGQFLIDSEASLRASATRLGAAAGASAAPGEHLGTGKIEALRDGAVTLSHGPIPTMQWGAMTMEFALPADGSRRELRVGEAVSFAFTMGADGKPRLTRIEPAAEPPQ